ncbi:MAG: ornithine aminomutase subunit alpha [Alphaproteobacteria bacterium]|nr:ornithine aminomutase subunit alpha [Alphaproteobacteria bacterium]
MSERPDEFESRRQHLRALSDEELHAHFWSLVEQVVDPLIDEARSYTSSSIERSVLLRMGLSSIEAKGLVDSMSQRGLLGHGAGRLVLELSKAKGVTVREAAEALLAGQHWEDLAP